VSLRVVHCPVNIAGIPWTNVRALRAKGVDAKLVVLRPRRLRPEEFDVNLDAPLNFWRAQPVLWPAFARLLRQADVFHFYFGQTLLPKSLQFPLLRAFKKKSVFHFVGSDVRGKTPEELAYAHRADERIVGAYDLAPWVPDAEVVPPGIDLDAFRAIAPVERDRPLVVHAPTGRERKGTEHVVAACEQLPVELDIVEGVPNTEARKRYAEADIVVDQLNAGWYGVFAIESMALGKPVVTYLRDDYKARTEEAFGIEVPIVSATKDTLVERLRHLVASFEERRRIGDASRAYVEQVHAPDKIADRLLEVYARL
jgi:glycosyltransferase involved in cell wall biosynthesis